MPDDDVTPGRSQSRELDDIDLQAAARLRQRRLALGLDPRLLDLAIGETPGSVERFEAGLRRLGAAHLYRLGRVLGVDVSYFFSAAAEEVPATVEPAAAADARALSEAQRFAVAFARLSDAEVRQTVLRLVKVLAEGGTAGDVDLNGPRKV